jgi:hypothetical protein
LGNRGSCPPTLDKLDLQSTYPTDLCVTCRGDIYLSQQSWVADQYSALISDACAVADRRTLEFHVPLAQLQASGLYGLEFQDETFKQLAFASKNRMKSRSRFEETYEKFSEYAFIPGPMLRLTICLLRNWRVGKISPRRVYPATLMSQMTSPDSTLGGRVCLNLTLRML